MLSVLHACSTLNHTIHQYSSVFETSLLFGKVQTSEPGTPRFKSCQGNSSVTPCAGGLEGCVSRSETLRDAAPPACCLRVRGGLLTLTEPQFSQ